jgi:polyisoprenoid-binding protein YceI
VKVYSRRLALALGLAVCASYVLPTAAQNPPAPQTTPAAPGRAGGAPPPPAPSPAPNGLKLELVDGTKATYRVQEQLAGINFPSEAAGSTSAVSGAIAIGPDGNINSAQSKFTVDLRTFKSDQDLRDGYIRTRVFDTEKFPLAEFVPRRAQGLTYPFPSGAGAQAGFQLIGDMTIRGVTKELTWLVVTTFSGDNIGGRAKTTFDFATFALPKPQLARLLSVDDKINLDVEIRAKRIPL